MREHNTPKRIALFILFSIWPIVIEQTYAEFLAEDTGIMKHNAPTREEFIALETRVTALENLANIKTQPATGLPQLPVTDSKRVPLHSVPEMVRGVLISRPLATEKEINALHYVSGMVFLANDPRAMHYNEKIGGAVGRIAPGERLCSIRKDRQKVLAPLTGRVYAQWDFYVPQSFYDLPWNKMSWSTIKTFRLFNIAKRIIRNNGSGTCTFLPARNQMWIRSAGQYGEGKGELRLDYLPPADIWVTHRITKDYDAMRLEFTSHNVEGKRLYKKTISMKSLTPIDNIAALMHSTSRGHSKPGDYLEHETFFGYRNLLLVAEDVSQNKDEH